MSVCNMDYISFVIGFILGGIALAVRLLLDPRIK